MGWSQYIYKIHSEVWPWFDPGSRLFYLNILSALGFTILFFVFGARKSFADVFSKNYAKKTIREYWLHPSAQVDYQIYIINGIIKVLFFAPILGLSFYISKFTIKFLYLLNPDFLPLEGKFIYYLGATVFVFVWDDFLRFYHHYLMHRISFLWTLHKTHHSAEVLTPITLYRIHPLESLLASFRNALSFGFSAGVIMFLFAGRMDILTLLGVNIFGFIFNLTAGNLRHSQIPISFGWLEYIFISPKQHQLHHSNQVAHFNKNYGVALSVWDQLLGSFLLSKNQQIKGYGVSGMSSHKLKNQFWSWKNEWNLNVYSMGIKFLFLCLFLMNSSLASAESQCAKALADFNFIVRDRIVTTKAVNLSKTYSTMDEGGWFYVRLKHSRSPEFHEIPAYFENVDFERTFEYYRFPFDPEINNYWVSGYIEYRSDINDVEVPVFRIVRFWKKSESFDYKSPEPLLFNRKTSL